MVGAVKPGHRTRVTLGSAPEAVAVRRGSESPCPQSVWYRTKVEITAMGVR